MEAPPHLSRSFDLDEAIEGFQQVLAKHSMHWFLALVDFVTLAI